MFVMTKLEGERSYVASGLVIFLFNVVHCDDEAEYEEVVEVWTHDFYVV